MAVIQAGFPRATADIDLLVDVDVENQERVRRALMKLPDRAVRDMAAGDLERYAVVRVADEIVVDLMKAACGIAYEEACREIDVVELDGVPIPFARSGWKVEVSNQPEAIAKNDSQQGRPAPREALDFLRCEHEKVDGTGERSERAERLRDPVADLTMVATLDLDQQVRVRTWCRHTAHE